MNRAQRRKQKSSRVNVEYLKRQIAEEVSRRTEKIVNDGRVEAMMLCFCLTLYEEFGFEQEQCLKALEAIDERMGTWVTGEDTIKTLQEKVADEIGIEVKC